MKIGIVTYHCSHNYGAFLQSYALVHALRENTEHDVETIDFNMSCAEKKVKEEINFNRRQIESVPYNIMRYFMFKKSKEKYLPVSEKKLVSDDLDDFKIFVEGKYDVIISGSDEVWKMNGFRGFPNPYWLPNVKGCLKMSYAASARNKYEDLSDKVKSKAEELALDFDYIGVRDKATKELLESIVKGEKTVHENCDPTFAYDFDVNPERGKEILKKKFGVDTSKKCIGLMCGVPSLAKMIVSELKNDCEIVSLYYYYRNTKGFTVLDPFEWIDVIAALDGFVTTFFHGMVFALKCNTPFIAIENREIDNMKFSKSYDILANYSLEDRCVLYKENEKEKTVKEVADFIADVSKDAKKCDFSYVCSQEKKKFKAFLDDMNKFCK